MARSTAKIIVTGLVQGVGFRYFVYRRANEFGLSGYARNLPSGQVEILAQGEKGMIDELVKAVQVGPSHASVSGVALEEIDNGQIFNDFNIR